MFFILNQICNDYTIAKIIDITKRIVDTIRMIAPILLILGLSINFAKGVINPEDKTVMKKVGTAIASTVIIAFLPFVINTIIDTISTYGGVGIKENGSSVAYNITACWNTSSATYANSNKSSSNTTSKSVATEYRNGSSKNSSNSKSNNYSSKSSSSSNKSSSSSNRSSSSNNKSSSSSNSSSSSSNKSSRNSNSNSNSSNKSSSNSNSSSSSNSNSRSSNNSSSNSNSSSNKNSTYNKVVLIGDSRFYGQSNYNFENSKTTYIAKSGEGLQFLKNSNSKIKSYDSNSTAFVINLGVNDLYNVNNYISYINSLALSLKGDVYYLSVNPVDEVKESYNGYSVKNSTINDFNSKMRSGLKNVKYLDSNSHLKSKGFDTVDGVHYTKDTYQKIYNFIATNVKS